MAANEKVEKVVGVKKVEKKELKTIFFQNPDDLVGFFNRKNLTLVAIVAFDRFQALYYYENK